jgi:hypothetical protein
MAEGDGRGVHPFRRRFSSTFTAPQSDRVGLWGVACRFIFVGVRPAGKACSLAQEKPQGRPWGFVSARPGFKPARSSWIVLARVALAGRRRLLDDGAEIGSSMILDRLGLRPYLVLDSP